MTGMHVGHAHGHGPVGSASKRHWKSLACALGLTLAYMVAEVVGGLMTGSLALLADAAHMLTDAGGLALALFAVRFAERPATPQKTYGYLRAEILSALVNAVVLLVVSIYILYEAYQRIMSPPDILSGPMLAVAMVGLLVNLLSMRLLATGASESLNVKGAYFEVLSDMLGSLGVIAAALIVMATGWTRADPIIAAAIGLFIVPRTWILTQAGHPHPARGHAAAGRHGAARAQAHDHPGSSSRSRPPCLDDHLGPRFDECPPRSGGYDPGATDSTRRANPFGERVQNRPCHHSSRR